MKKTNTIIELINMLKKENIYNDKIFKYVYRGNSCGFVTYHIHLDSSTIIDSYTISKWFNNNTIVLISDGIVLVTKDNSVFIRIQ